MHGIQQLYCLHGLYVGTTLHGQNADSVCQCSLLVLYIAYTCSSLLSIPNGAITYSQESTSNRYDIGTTATYSCSGRFYLSGGSTRSCTRSGTMGIWDGSASQCLGQLLIIIVKKFLDTMLTMIRTSLRGNCGFSQDRIN